MRHTGSRLDDVDDEDGGSVRPGVGLHHAAGEGGDPGEPLREVDRPQSQLDSYLRNCESHSQAGLASDSPNAWL